MDMEHADADVPAFGAWLVKQTDRRGFVGQLAAVAKADSRFPKSGDIEAVRAWLNGLRPSGDDWEALEDAENAWPGSH